MWPFDVWRRRKHERYYNAALVVMLGAHLPARLDPGTNARIEADVQENFKNSGDPPAAWNRWSRWQDLAAHRAVAMARLGIGPGLGDLDWRSLLSRWKAGGPSSPFTASFDELTFADSKFDGRAGFLLWDFHAFHPATEEAKAFLRQHGLEVPDIDPYGTGPMDETASILQGTGLAEHWRRKAKEGRR